MVPEVIGPPIEPLRARVSVVEFAAALDPGDLAELPPVLGVALPFTTIAERRTLLDASDLRPLPRQSPVVAAVTTLARSATVAIRTVRAGRCIRRVALCRGAGTTITVDSSGGYLEVQVLPGATPLVTLIARLPPAPPSTWPCGTPTVTAPRSAMVAALDRPTQHRFRSMGCTDEWAGQLERALGATPTHHEVTAGTALPVVLIDTRCGRLLASTRTGQDGRNWSTLGAASPSRVRSELDTLLGGRTPSDPITHSNASAFDLAP